MHVCPPPSVLASAFVCAGLLIACTSKQSASEPRTKAADGSAARGDAIGSDARDAVTTTTVGRSSDNDTAPNSDSDAGTAPGCAADSCSAYYSMRCVDGAVARCSIDANGCGTWRTFKTCAHGCQSAAVGCNPDRDAQSTGDAGPTTNAPGGTSPDVTRLNLETSVLAAQVGYYATPAPGQVGSFNGADLGWTFAHRDKLWVLFGDSWWIDPVNAASLPDDALGQISLTEFPDGPSVDAFVRAHPAPMGQPAWRAAGPTMPVALRGGAGSGFAPVLTERNGEMVRSGLGFVPMTGFSNGHDDEREGVFAIFFSYEAVECVSGQCTDGFECDPDLGTATREFLSPLCVVGDGSSCTASPGFCQDRSTSNYDTSAMGRTNAVVLRHDVGVTTAADPIHFKSQPWETQRFYNATSRAVSDFDPARANAPDNDYTPALGNSQTRSGVFIWGRPSFGGIGTEGRDAQLYLAWVPMPTPDADMHFEWHPQYFTGLDTEGRPQFASREIDARPLDLDASRAGDQPEEPKDVIGQMSISWVPSLKHFVMFYGGDIALMFAKPIFGTDIDKVRRDPQGSLFVRFAEQPWGPWTTPRPFMIAGNWSSDAEAIEQYGPGGILAHNNCRDADCARYDPAYRLDLGTNNNGSMYAPSIIDVWTTAHDGRTDLYWFLSTWNPYQVVLMKTSMSF